MTTGQLFRSCLFLTALISAGPPEVARATPTDPSLGIHAAAILPGTPRILRVDGTFHRDDLVQVPFPLQVLIHTTSSRSEAQYLLVEPGSRRVQGTTTILEDGLQTSDVAPLLQNGAPQAEAYVVELSENRIDITLPGGFPAGPAQVQLFVWNEGDPVLSNPLPVNVEPAR